MFTAALDACVLVPSLLRDVLLEVAERGVYRAVWSDRLLDEICRAGYGGDPMPHPLSSAAATDRPESLLLVALADNF